MPMRTALLILAALLSAPAFAGAAPAPAAKSPEPKKSSAPAAAAEDDEDEAPKAKDAPPPTSAPPAPAPLGAVTTSSADEKQQRLVSGAPLYNPNVAVHIVEQKEFSDKWLREVAIYPAAVQVNG